jgi:hypothetical protein
MRSSMLDPNRHRAKREERKSVVAGVANSGRIPVGPSLLVPLPTIRGSKLPTYAKPRGSADSTSLTAGEPGYNKAMNGCQTTLRCA